MNMNLTYEIKIKGSDEIKRYEVDYPINHYQNNDETRKSLIINSHRQRNIAQFSATKVR